MDDEVVGEKVQKSVPPLTTFRENVFIVHTNCIISDIWSLWRKNSLGCDQ